MTDQPQDSEEEYNTEDALLSKRINLSLVWLLPIIALLISAWLIFKSLSEKGRVITINFPTAEGLEVDKTKIRFLDVDVGKVTAITINEDMKTIRVTAQMDNSASDFLKEKTVFWVVKPQVSLGGVSGLSTLLSGSYIELKPGIGKERLNFNGLTEPPVLKQHADGKQFLLEATNLGSLRPGAPVSFHGIPVGEVLSHKLFDTADGIQLTVFIKAPYDQFVRTNTRFWIDSGVDLSANADGFKLRTGSLTSLLSGGIAFRTSPKDTPANVKPENTLFKLYDTYDESIQMTYTNTLKYVMHFDGSVRGLSIGAPVQLRGIPIGRVTDINLELDKKTAEIRIPVIVELEPERIEPIHDDGKVSDQDIMGQLINKGLRAQLQTGSLLTGQQLIDLDFHPGSKLIASFDQHTDYPEFPTVASKVEEFTHSAQTIMDKIAKLPLDKLATDMDKTLLSLQGTSKAATTTLHTANGALVVAHDTLGNTTGAMKSAKGILGNLEPGSNGYYEFHKMLGEFKAAAKSVRQLADYLEQHPESLIRGKDKKNDD